MRRIGKPKEYTPNDSSWARIYELLCPFPEFPESPWLAISAQKRKQRLSNLSQRTHSWRAAEIGEETLVAGAAAIDQPTENEGPFWERGIEVLSRYRSRSFGEIGAVRPIRVDWLRSNEEIVDQFRQWVVANRPADYGMYNRDGRPIKGKDAIRVWLRQLGAWTISSHTNPHVPRNISRNAALQLTTYTDDLGVRSKLYSGEKEIRDAESAAERLIGAITREYLLLRPRSAKAIPSPSLRIADGNPKDFTVTVKKERFVKFERAQILSNE